MRIHTFVLASLFVSCGLCAAAFAAPAPPAGTGIVRVDIAPAHRVQSLTTIDAIGSTVDKEPAGTIPSLYSSTNVRAINDAGLGWLSYRLFTELSDQDWHSHHAHHGLELRQHRFPAIRPRVPGSVAAESETPRLR